MITCLNTSDIENIAETKFGGLLQQVDLGKLDVFELSKHNQLDIQEELLHVVLDPVDNTQASSYVGDDVVFVKNCVLVKDDPINGFGNRLN